MIRRHAERGQALVMVTLAVVAMFGFIGLAVDLGWAFYIRRSAQTAADAAALAAARQALFTVGQAATFNCGSSVNCSATPVSCPGGFGGSLATACTYAETNGFTNAGRKRVTVAADVVANPALCVPNCIPTAAGVAPLYWVTVRISEDIPQLFSAVLGNTLGTSSARATAVVIGVGVNASVILTNRENDTSGVGNGRNLGIIGSASVNVPGGIRLASASSSGSGQNGWAGYTQGNAAVTSAYTQVRNGGRVNDPNAWNPQPVNRPDGSRFRDPYEGKGQPPVTTSTLPNCPIKAGTVLQGTLGPGNYYYVEKQGNTYRATGQPIVFGAGVRFAAQSSSTAVDFRGDVLVQNTCLGGTPTDGSVLGNYVFYGGLQNANGSTPAIVEPGRYVLAGTAASGNNARLLDLGNGVPLQDLTAGGNANTDAGALFILTNGRYQGGDGSSLDPQFASIPLLNQIRDNLVYRPTHIQGGAQSQQLNLHGLNPDSTAVQNASNLEEFGPVVFWQDRNNSRVRHTAEGRVDTSCGGVNSPCTNSLTNPDSPEFFYQGSPNSVLYGVIAQPRGAWAILQGGGAAAGNNQTQILSGAIQVQGSASLNFGILARPVTVRRAVLVE